MTKQHFIALAAEIAKIEEKSARESAAFAVARVAQRFSSKFDVARFYAACSVI